MASQRIIDLPADTNPPLTSVTVSVNGTTYEQVSWANVIKSMIANSTPTTTLGPTDQLVAVSGGSNAQVTPSGIVKAAIGSSSFLRNRLINGGFSIDQRNNGASVANVAGAVYGVDRWNISGTVASKFTAQQQNLSAGFASGSCYQYVLTSSSAYSLGSSDYFTISQAIEANNLQDLAWGTSIAKSVTLSFWVYASASGTYGGSIRNYAGTRSYPFTFSIPVANTGTLISITIPGDTAGTWVSSGTGGALFVIFSFGAGSVYCGTAGSWSSSNYVGATGQTNPVTVNGATLQFSAVQLEIGSASTPFEQRLYGHELALCQRYCYVIQNQGGGTLVLCSAYVQSSGTAFGPVHYPQVMRAAPTFTAVGTAANWQFNSTASNAATTQPALNQGSPYSCLMVITTGATTVGYGGSMLNTVAGGQAIFSAEL